MNSFSTLLKAATPFGFLVALYIQPAMAIQYNTELLAEYRATLGQLSIKPQRETCQIPQPEKCEMQAYCKHLQSQRNELQLYKSNDGRAVTNFPLVTEITKLSACAQQPMLDMLGPLTPYAMSGYAYGDTSLSSPALQSFQQKMIEKTKADQERVNRLFNETKQRLLQFLNSKTTPRNQAEMAQLKLRIQEIKINPVDYTDYDQAPTCSVPNAYYHADKHSVTICPTLFEMPDAALESTIAHELAHGIDPCALSRDYQNTSTPVNKGNGYQPIPSDSNPFASAVSCLQSSRSMGTSPNSFYDIRADVELQARRLQEEMGFTEDEVQAYIEDEMAQKGSTDQEIENCSDFEGSSKNREAFADWMAAEVMEQKINNLPTAEQRKTAAFEAQMIHLTNNCSNIQNLQKERMLNALQSSPQLRACYQERFGAGGAEITSHPPSAQRINRIYMTKPGIQKALGCKASGNYENCQ